MKTPIFKLIISGIPTAIVVLAFFVFSSGSKAVSYSPVFAGSCCSGSTIATTDLHRFMLDSLTGIQYEGGVYAKTDLANAIKSVPGDSVYIMNVLSNCQEASGTDLVVTSRSGTGVSFVRKKCYNCPGKPCCRASVCAARINRGCINYMLYQPASAAISAEGFSLSE